MTDQTKKSSDKKKPAATRGLIIGLAAVVVIAAVFLLGMSGLTGISFWPGTTESSADTTGPTTEPTLAPGVLIGDVDVSGLTREAAVAAAAPAVEKLLAGIRVTVLDGETSKTFNGLDLGLGTDLEAVVAQAMDYRPAPTESTSGTSGQTDAAPVKFELKPVADLEPVLAALQAYKLTVDVAPVDAVVTFMPWGYTADGQAYAPDPTRLADAQARGKNLDRPELVRLSAEEMPDILRYQFWAHNGRYIKDYVPADASIARFLYTAESAGRSLDIDALAAQIISQVETGDDSAITAVFEEVAAAVAVADLKKGTQLISSWSSSYRNHAGTSRNWNVSRMSSYVNGAVLEPGDTWSANDIAGPRDERTALTIGWKKAAGILAGGYTEQYGGGVCQLGSTTFNAAKRAGVTIVESTHHTIPSDYIPLGLDATLNSGAQDLILRNDKDTTFYIVSYVNPQDQNVTVEVYGAPLIDPVYGEVIYDFTSDNRGERYGEPVMNYVFNATTAPDETILSDANPVYLYAKIRYGVAIQTYKHIYSLDGRELCDPIPDEYHKYPAINGTTYVFGPALPTPPVETTVPVETTPPAETTAPVETTTVPVETTAAPAETTIAPSETTAAP